MTKSEREFVDLQVGAHFTADCETGTVYVLIAAGKPNLCKIGRSVEPLKRVQVVANQTRLTVGLVCYVETTWARACAMETAIKHDFSYKSSFEYGNEWFDMPAIELIERVQDYFDSTKGDKLVPVKRAFSPTKLRNSAKK